MEIKGRFDHFNINVTDLERSLKFYDEALGLKEISRQKAADGSYELVFVGDDVSPFKLELTWLRDHAATPLRAGRKRATSASAWRATTMPCASTTVRAAGYASRTTRWGSISSTTRTTTGSKCFRWK